MPAAGIAPGAIKAVTPAVRAGARMAPTCGPPRLNNNAITYSRALRVGQPYGWLRLGRFRSDFDAKLVNEVQMSRGSGFTFA